jgi:hypothetical protein
MGILSSIKTVDNRQIATGDGPLPGGYDRRSAAKFDRIAADCACQRGRHRRQRRREGANTRQRQGISVRDALPDTAR